MPFNEIDLFNDHLLLLRENLQDPATLTLLLAVDHHHKVILFDMKFGDAHFKFRSSGRLPAQLPEADSRQGRQDFKVLLELKR
jgi:hypothetical protein